jgi:O-acetyl-ADP-ribose deacetylase (regulator of RNase III)
MTAKITLLRDDITVLQVDALVNAANSSLLGGSGVDGAIHQAAGPELLEACKKLNGCQPGHAKITEGYLLSAKSVIHTVGPIWQGGNNDEPEILAQCYRNSLLIAANNGIRSIAFPAISCGAYKFPIDLACQIAVNSVTEQVSQLASIRKVIFCAFDDIVYQHWLTALGKSHYH